MNKDWSILLEASSEKLTIRDIELFESNHHLILPSLYREFILSCNGGKVCQSHEIPVQIRGEQETIFVDTFFPLIAKSSRLTVVDLISKWIACGICLGSLVPIGDDRGVGVFFIDTHNSRFGKIYYVYQDEIIPGFPLIESFNAETNEFLVADKFDELVGKILGIKDAMQNS